MHALGVFWHFAWHIGGALLSLVIAVVLIKRIINHLNNLPGPLMVEGRTAKLLALAVIVVLFEAMREVTGAFLGALGGIVGFVISLYRHAVPWVLVVALLWLLWDVYTHRKEEAARHAETNKHLRRAVGQMALANALIIVGLYLIGTV